MVYWYALGVCAPLHEVGVRIDEEDGHEAGDDVGG